VHIAKVKKHPALIAQGGKIIVDRVLLDLLQQAKNQDLETITTSFEPREETQFLVLVVLARVLKNKFQN